MEIFHHLSRNVRFAVTPHPLCLWCRDTFVAPLYEYVGHRNNVTEVLTIWRAPHLVDSALNP